MPDWIEVTVLADGEAAEAVAEMLHRYAYQGVLVEQRFTTSDDDTPPGDPQPEGPLAVRAYLPDDDEAPAKQRKIEEALYFLGKLYPIPEPIFTRVQDENWADAWKKHYHPVRVGRKLLIKPAWLEADLQPDDVIIEIDPGMAFGTGTHPSTQLCLMALEDLVAPGHRVLDLGCGSGILGIAALKLGAGQALGLDTDTVAVRVAGENAAINGVADRFQVERGSLENQVHAPRRFDLVLVNILAPVIIHMSGEGLGVLARPGGYLVAAGIINEQADDVTWALEQQAGLIVEKRLIEGDWVALIARRPDAS